MCINLFDNYNSVRKILLLFLLYRWGNWGLNKWTWLHWHWVESSELKLRLSQSRTFLLNLKMIVLVTQSCPMLCDPMDCSLPGSSVLGILQARTREWVPIFLLQRTFPTQGLNLGLLHLQADSLLSEPLGKPFTTFHWSLEVGGSLGRSDDRAEVRRLVSLLQQSKGTFICLMEQIP